MEIRGHFDGKVIVLDEPIPSEWKPNMKVIVTVTAPAEATKDGDAVGPNPTLLKLAEEAANLGLPADFSEQHDHYIHGTPKR